MSPTTVPRETTFKFWAQGLTPKTNYKLYFVDNLQLSAGLNCHSTDTVFTTKYRKYSSTGAVVIKTGMRTNGAGELDSNLTMSGIQPHKAFLPGVYPADSVESGPHDYKPGVYPEPGVEVPTGRSSVCGREVDAAGNLTDYTVTQHLMFTVS